MSDIQTGNIEYDRRIWLNKDVKGFDDAPTFYIADLSTTEMTLTLQDVTTKVPCDGFESVVLSPILIESPVGSASPLNGTENHVIVEFVLPKPSGDIPPNSNWFVEWGDEIGDLDWCELYANDKLGDTPLEVGIPY